MRISCMHIKPVLDLITTVMHNDREKIPSYVIANSDCNVCTHSSEEVYALFMKLMSLASKNYTMRTKQKIQTKSEKWIWEAVIVLDKHHTLDDLLKLGKIFEKQYGWRVLQTSIHHDEGYVNEDSGQKIFNWHAHIIIMMIDNNGIYRFKKRDFGKRKMSELQTLVAKKLNMKRGVSKMDSKRENLNHKQYRQVKKELDNLHSKLELVTREAYDFEEIMLVENKLRIQNEAKNVSLQRELEFKRQRIEELEDAYASAEWESECAARLQLCATKDAAEKSDKIIQLEARLEKLQHENCILKESACDYSVGSSMQM